MEKYSERLNDIAILQLNTEGFEKLTDKQKSLTYYLAKAGLWGRYISIDQGSEYNIPLFNSLINLYEKVNVDKYYILHGQLHDTLFTLFSHNGIYHSMSGEKLALPLDMKILETYSEDTELVQTIKELWFSNKIPKFRTVQTEGVDVIKESGGNFYKNLTIEEVNTFRKENYPQIDGEEIPPFGFNERLVKNEGGEITREIISSNGLYSNCVINIVDNLSKALEFAENDKQYESIKTLIDFYNTGDAADFDKHCIAWTQDQDSDVFFINGLIESYEDPLGIACSFESLVAFKNPLQTAKVNKIIDNIQWFENNLPFDDKFKKEKAVGLSASSITVISMAGDTSPTLPLGVNLPNSDWIRKVHGSKSVNLENVASSRSSYEVPLRKALYLEKYHDGLAKYANMTNSLHTDLHEIAGHGSGKILPGVSNEMIGTYYSTLEEARADLVALYFMNNEKLKEFGVFDNDVDVKEAATAQYVTYLTNGAIGQLRRVNLGNDLTQAHFRNRQLIALWVLNNADSSKVKMIENNGQHYIEVNDVDYVQEMFGKLLNKVQTIKSTGDFEAAKELIMTYGTKVDQNIHAEIITRIEKLNMPKVVGFITPVLEKEDNKIIIKQSDNFFKQQIELHKNFNQQVENKMKVSSKKF